MASSPLLDLGSGSGEEADGDLAAGVGYVEVGNLRLRLGSREFTGRKEGEATGRGRGRESYVHSPCARARVGDRCRGRGSGDGRRGGGCGGGGRGDRVRRREHPAAAGLRGRVSMNGEGRVETGAGPAWGQDSELRKERTVPY